MRARWIASPAAVAKVADRLIRVLAAPAAAYEPFRVEDRIVGWVTPARAQRLARWPALFERTERGVACAPRLRTPRGAHGGLGRRRADPRRGGRAHGVA